MTEAKPPVVFFERALPEEELPAPPVTRWTPRRKVAVLAAVVGRQLTIEEACARYELSEEELAGWLAVFNRYGAAGLRVSRPHGSRIILRAGRLTRSRPADL